jgi:hypothetical protein
MKMVAMGSLSGDPKYFLEPTDGYRERWSMVVVNKRTGYGESDPNLHPLLNQNVEITGIITEKRDSITVDYDVVTPLGEE